MINPYEFLGVTFQDSLATVKRRYYELSRLCHPDKGGNANDMLALQSAYWFVKRELEYANAQSSSVPIQELEALYESFKQTSLIESARIPNYHDVVAEMIGFSYDRFHEMCHKGKEVYNCMDWHGYYYAILSMIVPKIEVEVEVDVDGGGDTTDTIPDAFKGDALWSYVREQFEFLWNASMNPADMMYASIPHGYDSMVPQQQPSTTSKHSDLIIYTSTDSSQFNLHDGQHSNIYRPLEDYSVYENELFDYALAYPVKDIQRIHENNENNEIDDGLHLSLDTYMQTRSNMDIELDAVLKNKGVVLV